MFEINRKENRIERLTTRRFADLNLRERDHLQEWLANTPDALGEELLIIQKEFDGFADTRERLDLLALDKDGRLVIIENKLDDSGRDVAWQALKYTAYCSSLKKAEIVDIFQQYLERYCDGGNAEELICEFLEVEEIAEIVLNPGNDQRLMFIAANFRKEVTSTVLWLLGHGVTAQCFKVTPFARGDDLFLDVQQIIPTPEAEDFMVGMASKESEEKSTSQANKKREKLRLEFWERTLEALRQSGTELYKNISPAKSYWLVTGSGVRSCPYEMIFLKKDIRVQIKLDRRPPSENKWLFDKLHEQKGELEKRFGAPLIWERADHKLSSRIKYVQTFDGFNEENWPEMIDWLVKHMTRFEDAFREPLAALVPQLNALGGDGDGLEL